MRSSKEGEKTRRCYYLDFSLSLKIKFKPLNIFLLFLCIFINESVLRIYLITVVVNTIMYCSENCFYMRHDLTQRIS